PGPGSTLDTLKQELRARSASVSELDAILLTHIHLDHAGATGALVRENPGLAVYVHRLGAPHMIDPSKLLASAARLWPDNLQQLFGEALPVPAENLHILEGGETIRLGSRKIEVAYTPLHPWARVAPRQLFRGYRRCRFRGRHDRHPHRGTLFRDAGHAAAGHRFENLGYLFRRDSGTKSESAVPDAFRLFRKSRSAHRAVP